MDNYMSRCTTSLGDGVFCFFDGYQIWLVTDREGTEHYIAIEPETMNSLIKFAKLNWEMKIS